MHPVRIMAEAAIIIIIIITTVRPLALLLEDAAVVEREEEELLNHSIISSEDIENVRPCETTPIDRRRLPDEEDRLVGNHPLRIIIRTMDDKAVKGRRLLRLHFTENLPVVAQVIIVILLLLLIIKDIKTMDPRHSLPLLLNRKPREEEEAAAVVPPACKALTHPNGLTV